MNIFKALFQFVVEVRNLHSSHLVKFTNVEIINCCRLQRNQLM